MFLLFVISVLCGILLPAIALYFAGSVVVGPLLWVGRTMKLGRQTKTLLLDAGDAPGLSPTDDPNVRARLSQIALTSWSSRARDFEGDADGLRVLVRTQPRTVGSDGEPLRFPWTRRERQEARQVLGMWVVIDTNGRLRPGLDLHVALGREDAVVGDEALAVALLDGGVRRYASPGDQLTISEQLVGYDSPFGIHRARQRALIDELTRMTERLLAATTADGIDRGTLLLENAREDADELVRARSVDMLLRSFPELAEETLDAALEDDAPAVRFAAARHLDPIDSFDIVLGVLDSRKAGEGLRERALRYIIRNCRSKQTLNVLELYARGGPSGLRNIAIRHLGELAYAPAVPWMREIVADADPRTMIDIATALADIGTADAEPILHELLDVPNTEVQLAVVDALGTVGRLDSVARLLPLAKSRMTDARVQLAATTAVRMIQVRHARTGSGALSMAEDPSTGHLSVASTEPAGPHPSNQPQ